MKRVLIVNYSFPPINNVTASQYGEFVYFMPKFGWEPFVLTTKSQGELPVKISENNIIRMGKHCHSGKKNVPERYDSGIPKLLRPFYSLYGKLGIEIRSVDRFSFSWKKEALKNLEAIKKINPDVIVGVTPPVASLWLAREIALNLKKPWIADFRDPCSLYNHSKNSFVRFLDKIMDKFLVKTSAGVVTVGPSLASLMEGLYGKPAGVIYNGFNKKVIEKAVDNNSAGKFFYSAGIFFAQRLDAVKLFIDWLSDNKDVRYVIRSKGPVESNEKISEYAKSKGVKIDILPPVPPETINKERQNALGEIVFEGMKELNPTSSRAMPGKLFEALPFSAPIVVISQRNSDMEEVLRETRRGYLVSTREELDDAMKNILRRNVPVPDWDKVEDYSRENQCKNLCNLLNETVKN